MERKSESEKWQYLDNNMSCETVDRFLGNLGQIPDHYLFVMSTASGTDGQRALVNMAENALIRGLDYVADIHPLSVIQGQLGIYPSVQSGNSFIRGSQVEKESVVTLVGTGLKRKNQKE